MLMESNKKMAHFCLLYVLREYSDESHLLTQKRIAELVDHHFGLQLERKSIGKNLLSLKDFGYDIVLTPKGCYWKTRELQESEISFLVDAVFSSKSIDSKNSIKLAEKLSKFLSQNQRKKYNYIVKADEVVRTDSQEIFKNINLLNEAMEKGKQVKLKYHRFYFDKVKNETKKNRERIINPYFMVNNQGRYYLVCNLDCYDDIANYKLELISDIKILTTDVKPITEIKGFEKGIDMVKYANENIYMFRNNPVDATLKINTEYAANYVLDWFGKNADFYSKNGEVFADVHVNEDALLYWCLQYGETIELVEPEETRKKLQEKVKKISEIYK